MEQTLERQKLKNEIHREMGKAGGESAWRGRVKGTFEYDRVWAKAAYVNATKTSTEKANTWLVGKFGEEKAAALLKYWGF